MGTNDQIMQGGKLIVKRFQRSSQLLFPLIDPYWVIDILFNIVIIGIYTNFVNKLSGCAFEFRCSYLKVLALIKNQRLT